MLEITYQDGSTESWDAVSFGQAQSALDLLETATIPSERTATLRYINHDGIRDEARVSAVTAPLVLGILFPQP